MAYAPIGNHRNYCYEPVPPPDGRLAAEVYLDGFAAKRPPEHYRVAVLGKIGDSWDGLPTIAGQYAAVVVRRARCSPRDLHSLVFFTADEMRELATGTAGEVQLLSARMWKNSGGVTDRYRRILKSRREAALKITRLSQDWSYADTAPAMHFTGGKHQRLTAVNRR